MSKLDDIEARVERNARMKWGDYAFDYQEEIRLLIRAVRQLGAALENEALEGKEIFKALAAAKMIDPEVLELIGGEE